jgi:hypothetical protein
MDVGEQTSPIVHRGKRGGNHDDPIQQSGDVGIHIRHDGSLGKSIWQSEPTSEPANEFLSVVGRDIHDILFHKV